MRPGGLIVQSCVVRMTVGRTHLWMAGIHLVLMQHVRHGSSVCRSLVVPARPVAGCVRGALFAMVGIGGPVIWIPGLAFDVGIVTGRRW